MKTTFPITLKHMTSTPMTQEEMQKQCEIVSKIAQFECSEEMEIDEDHRH